MNREEHGQISGEEKGNTNLRLATERRERRRPFLPYGGKFILMMTIPLTLVHVRKGRRG